MEYVEKICKMCGETFVTNHPRQIYCRQTKIKTCPICGEQFEQICQKQVSSVCSKPECIKASYHMQPPKKTKTCKICGEQFIPKSYNSRYCEQYHTRTCSICGKEFQYKCEANSDPNVCYECRHNKYKRICIYCGKTFISDTPSKQICDGKHYHKCIICGKEFEVPRDRLFDETLNTCSQECSSIKRGRSIKSALKMLPKGYNQPKTTYTKICKFCGKEFTTHNFKQVYCSGPHYKLCEVCGKQFEVDLSQIANHTTVCSNECRVIKSTRAHLKDPAVSKNWEKFKNDPKFFISTYFDDSPGYYELSDKLGISISAIQQYLNRCGLEHLVKKHVPSMEFEVIQYIKSIDDNIIILHNDRKAIHPKQLDIYLPQYNVAIECNPVISHNVSYSPWNDDTITVDYHKNKTDLCRNAGIQLLHVFGWEWLYKQDIMKSMIKNLIKHNECRIYARNCEIRDVDSHESMTFLEHNHRQGKLGSKIRLGLYYNDKLVSLMTFGNVRKSISDRSSYDWELLRFCNTLNTSVVGGASKLFSYFLKTYNPSSIISYADRAHTSGNIYKVLGFKFVRYTDPGYTWCDLKTDKSYHRMNAQKQNIKKFLHDDSIDLSKSEREIMESHGFVRVFDSGVDVWEWNR